MQQLNDLGLIRPHWAPATRLETPDLQFLPPKRPNDLPSIIFANDFPEPPSKLMADVRPSLLAAKLNVVFMVIIGRPAESRYQYLRITSLPVT